MVWVVCPPGLQEYVAPAGAEPENTTEVVPLHEPHEVNVGVDDTDTGELLANAST